MNIYDYCDAINTPLSVIRYPNQHERWIAFFENHEIQEGAGLSSNYGSGHSAEEAIRDYIKLISEKTLVKKTYTTNRQEFIVPSRLEV